MSIEHPPKTNGNGDGYAHMRISKNTARWVLLGCVVFSLLFSFAAAYYTLTKTTNDVAENSASIDRFKAAFQADKVCSLSNQGKACVDLFDRLERNITPAQKEQLACGILETLDIPEADVWRKKAECP